MFCYAFNVFLKSLVAVLFVVILFVDYSFSFDCMFFLCRVCFLFHMCVFRLLYVFFLSFCMTGSTAGWRQNFLFRLEHVFNLAFIMHVACLARLSFSLFCVMPLSTEEYVWCIQLRNA